MPLQMREMRLLVKGRISLQEEVGVKLVSSPSPSPSPPTPPTKPGGALYGLAFTGDAVEGSGSRGLSIGARPPACRAAIDRLLGAWGLGFSKENCVWLTDSCTKITGAADITSANPDLLGTNSTAGWGLPCMSQKFVLTPAQLLQGV